MTRAQAAALATDFADFELPKIDGSANQFDGVIETAFARVAPVALEIGFGMGQGLIGYASAHPDTNCIGVEVYRPGIGSLVAALRRNEIGNVRIYEGDARPFVAMAIPERALSVVMIYFPDPWPKQRHRKRRLIEPGFVATLARRLRLDGRLLVATDWEDYAHATLALLDAEPLLANDQGTGFSPRPDDRPVTRFEARGLGLGHRVWDLSFTRRAS